MSPVSGNNAQNRQVHGALSLHVGDLLMTGDDVCDKEITGRLRKHVQVGCVTTSTVGTSTSIRMLALMNFTRFHLTKT